MKGDLDKDLDLLEKKVRKTVRKLNDLAQSYLNETAIRFLEDKLEREYGIKVTIIPIIFEKIGAEFIVADLGDKLVLGKVRRRATLKTLFSLEKSIEKLLKIKPEYQKKKIIPMIYAKRATEELIEECRRKGIYLTLGEDGDLTPLRL